MGSARVPPLGEWVPKNEPHERAMGDGLRLSRLDERGMSSGFPSSGCPNSGVHCAAGGETIHRRVAAILAEDRAERASLLGVVSLDERTEFTSESLNHWANWIRVRLDLSRPGKPKDTAVAEV